MEPIPLIPEIRSKICPDTSHVIREEFQELLGQKPFPVKIAKNLKKLRTDNFELLYCGLDVDQAYNDTKISLEDLTDAEQSVMKSQGEYLIEKDKIGKNIPLEKMLKAKRLFPEIDRRTINKYSLLNPDDLYPHITERILDFRLTPDDYDFNPPCPENKEKFEEEDNLSAMKCCKDEGKGKRYKLESSEFPKKVSKRGYGDDIKRLVTGEPPGPKRINRPAFVPEPKKIMFLNYEQNKLYKKTLNLRNITTKPQTFTQPCLSPHSKFAVITNTGLRIAPGMYASFTITYFNNTFTDAFDMLKIVVPGSHDITVELASFRQSPLIKGLVYYSEDFLNDVKVDTPTLKNEALNSSIDCGACLLGYNTKVNIVIQNCGGPGKFFIVSEEDWIYRFICDITDDYVILLNDFIVYPAYFELDEDEIIELTIHFFPSDSGLCLDKMYLLCNNNTMEEIDLIADCLLYAPYFLSFEMPELPYSKPRKRKEPKYNLPLGAVYTNLTQDGEFIVKNNSSLKIPYEWRKRQADFRKADTKTLHLKEDWIKINPDRGEFQPDCCEEFNVVVNMPTEEFGLYNFVLSLYILDIPEVCLEEGPIFTFGEEYKEEGSNLKLLSILVNEVEVQIHHIPLAVSVFPDEIHCENLRYKSPTCFENIEVVNNGYMELKFEWLTCDGCSCDNCCVVVKPKEFVLLAGNSQKCTLFIIPMNYDKINENVTLKINEGYGERQIRVYGEVEKPRVYIEKKYYNFGIVSKCSEVVFDIPVVSTSEITSYWRMEEYRYDFLDDTIKEACICNVSCNYGQLCHKDSYCLVTYTMDTRKVEKYFAIIVFYTMIEKMEFESAIVIVVADIKEPKVTITNESSGDEIFKISEEFYVKQKISRLFYLENAGLVDGTYSWGEPFGFNKNYLSVTFDYNSGKVYPNSRKAVNCEITFLQAGLIHDFYVPCAIESIDEPLYLQICCTVKNLQVIFSIPAQIGFINIKWPFEKPKPPEIIEDMEEETQPEENRELQYQLLFKNQLIDGIKLEDMDPNPSDSVLDVYNNMHIDVMTYLKNCSMCDESEYHCPTAETSVADNVNVSKEEITQSVLSLSSVFTSENIVHDYVIEFPNVPVREPYKKSMFIQNNTLISTTFSVCVNNFQAKEILPKPGIEDILIEMKWKERNELAEKLTEHGILVIATPISGNLDTNTIVTVEFLVYAETWGTYLEDITIDIEDIPTFHLSLIIQIVGCPIEYPALLNAQIVNVGCPAQTITSDPVLRFGNFSYGSEPEKRLVKVYNNSTIPCTVGWHILTELVDDFLKGPINILIDLFGHGEENDVTDCKMRFIKYIGKESTTTFDLFKIEPHETYIPPRETSLISITIDPTYFQRFSNALDISAILIGHVYITDTCRYIPNLIKRPKDYELPPTKVQLLAHIAISQLDLQHVRGITDICMSIHAIVMEKKNETFMRLVFKNNDETPICVNMNISEPFKVMSMKNAFTDSTDYNVKGAVVPCGECVEVMVKCSIDNFFLMNIADALYKKGVQYMNDMNILKNNRVAVTRELNIYQKSNVKQSILLTVTLSFPCFTLSTDIVKFGNVCLGTKKKMVVKLINKTATPFWFRTIFEVGENYVLKPDSGVLPPATICEQALMLTVTFTPTENLEYYDRIIFETCLHQYVKEIQLIGSGTFDEKFYMQEVVKKEIV